MATHNVYSFRINLDLEKIALAMGYDNVSDFVRDAIFNFIRDYNGDDEYIKLVIQVDELYRRYRKIRRLMGTVKEIGTLQKIAELEGWDNDISHYAFELLKRKIEIEKKILDIEMRKWRDEDESKGNK